MSEARDTAAQEILRRIPSVDSLLERDDVSILQNKYSRELVLKAVQKKLDKMRRKVLAHTPSMGGTEDVTFEITGYDIEREIITFSAPLLEKVINATGVVIHTNLGRSPLSEFSIEHLSRIARFYSNLEYDVEKGARGSRYAHVEELICELTGAEAAFVVNNNAAAVLLTLNTLANGREALISRGELIEIGGSFRIPDVMRRSGARMVEVGTTNRTHLSDYERAINDATGVILKVHTSNYKIVGFASEVELPHLVELGNRFTLPLVNDLGSGNLIDFSPYGIDHEPTVQEVVKTGLDVTTFSGDKLLGGPQAGIIVGKRGILEKLIKNPLNRALRIDKLTLAALESTLRLYLDPATVIEKIPTLRMITLPLKEIERRVTGFKKQLLQVLPDHMIVQIDNDISQVGGGALPSQELPTKVITLHSPSLPVMELEKRLRNHAPPIIARINKDQLRIDLRTVHEEDEAVIVSALKIIVNGFS